MEKNLIHWSDSVENIIKKEGERAQSYSWIHHQSQIKYKKYNDYLTIPSIILCIINGSLSVGSESLFNNFSYSNVIIGFISILSSIMISINSYFKNETRSANHKISSISFESINRLITIELALCRKERLDANSFIRLIKEDLNKLNEISPPIDDDIIKKYKKTFKITGEIAIPLICNGLDSIMINSEEIIITPIIKKPDIKITIT